MILQTPIILGASIGILVYNFLPKPIVTGLLVLLIIGAAIKSLLKGLKLYKHETADKKAQVVASILIQHEDLYDQDDEIIKSFVKDFADVNETKSVKSSVVTPLV